MPIDFSKIKTTGNRPYKAEQITALNDSLRAFPIKQRASILGTFIEESGGDPMAESENGTYQGLLQWGDDRYRISSDDPQVELANQLRYLRSSINDTIDGKSWTHGGEGSGYNSFRETYNTFNNKDLPLEDIYRAFSYGYVRPKGKEDSYSNRLKVVQQVYDILKNEKTDIPKPVVQHVEQPDAIKPLYPYKTPMESIRTGLGPYEDGYRFTESEERKTKIKEAVKARQLYNKVMNTTSLQNTAIPQFKSPFAEGGFLQPRDAWDKLSMREKAAMMKVAVDNDIFNLNDIRAKYNEFAEGGKKEDGYYSQMEKVAEENYRNWGYNNPDEALVHALNDNTYNYRDYYRNNLQSVANATTHWPDTYKTVYHPTFSNESIYSGKASQYNPQGLYGGHWIGEKFIPAPWQRGPLVEAAMNEYKSGGGIHIKPSHRGRLTELKKRTGKTEAELYNDGNPAHKKMVVFARSARKWKHDLGGPLVENLFEEAGQINISPYRYVQDDSGNWNRITNDELGRVFQGFTVTPTEVIHKSVPVRYDNSYPLKTKDDGKPIRKFFEAVNNVMETPIMVQQTPGTPSSYSAFGQYMPKSESTIGNQTDLLITELTAPTILSDLKAAYQILRHPTQTMHIAKNKAKAIKNFFSDSFPERYDNVNHSIKMVNGETLEHIYTDEDKIAVLNNAVDFFNKDVLPRLRKYRQGEINPRMMENSPYLGRAVFENQGDALFGSTSPKILTRDGIDYSVTLNANDVSPMKEKMSSAIHEFRHDMQNYHSYQYDAQDWMNDMQNYTIALQNGDVAEQKRLAAEIIKKQKEMQPYISMEHPGYTKNESDLLSEAYKVGTSSKNFTAENLAKSAQLKERGAFNTELRSKISYDNNSAVGDELDIIIDNMEDGKLLDYFKNDLSYGRVYYEYLENLSAKEKKAALQNIREALKKVGISTGAIYVATQIPE